MAIDYNKVSTTFNGLSFIGAYSQRPICGALAGHNRNTLAVAKLAPTTATDKILPAYAVQLDSNSAISANTNAGVGLNPNVFTAKKLDVTTGTLSGFLLVNEKDVLEHGDVAAYARYGQIVNVATLGSMAEIYLPCDNTIQGLSVGATLYWDATANLVKGAETIGVTAEIKGAILLSQVVDGVRFVEDANGNVKYEACKCAKIRLA